MLVVRWLLEVVPFSTWTTAASLLSVCCCSMSSGSAEKTLSTALRMAATFATRAYWPFSRHRAEVEAAHPELKESGVSCSEMRLSRSMPWASWASSGRSLDGMSVRMSFLMMFSSWSMSPMRLGMSIWLRSAVIMRIWRADRSKSLLECRERE